MSPTANEVAHELVTSALQNWGQTDDSRVEAWDQAFRHMRLNVTVEVKGREVVVKGKDAETARKFVAEVRKNFPLGKVQKEIAAVERILDKYKKPWWRFW